MSPPLSPATRALLNAAKADGPSAAARAKVWSGVSGAVGGAVAAGGAATAAGAAGALGAVGGSAAKMLAIGTLLGGTVTVGLATMLLRIGSTPMPVPAASQAAVVAAAFASPGATCVPQSPLLAPPAGAPTAGAAQIAAAAPTPSPGSGAHSGHGPHATGAPRSESRPTITPAAANARAAGSSAPEDPLAKEARLVTEARARLSAGDAQAALRLVRAARSMHNPQLVPEELVVEAQALRALGQVDDARGVDATLRAQYPDSALAR